MIECLVVGIGGFIGAICRYLMGLIPIKVTFLNTMIINIIGAMVIGLVVALGSKYPLDNRVILFLKTWICGGFTTFSTFSLETVDLISNGKVLTAFIYVVLTVIFCILAVWFGKCIVVK